MIRWAFGGLILGGVCFFVAMWVIDNDWLGWSVGMLLWSAIAFYGIKKAVEMEN